MDSHMAPYESGTASSHPLPLSSRKDEESERMETKKGKEGKENGELRFSHVVSALMKCSCKEYERRRLRRITK